MKLFVTLNCCNFTPGMNGLTLRLLSHVGLHGAAWSQTHLVFSHTILS